MRGMFRSSATSALASVRPSIKPRTSRRSWGRYSMTGAPAPAAAAVTEFRYSQSRSMASSSVPPKAMRATKVPSGVVTL